MGQVTASAQVWTPDQADLNEPDVYLATMSASIENGLGQRVNKLESFVGCNLSLTSKVSYSGGTVGVVPFVVTQPFNFVDEVTNNPDGSVQIDVPGIYQVNLNAVFLPTNTTAARINTYLYKNGAGLAFSSTYGETVVSRYSNCNIAGVYKFVVGDVITARVAVFDGISALQDGTGSSLSLALISRS